MTRSFLVTKQMVWTTKKAVLGVYYWLLCTDLGDGILFILSLNQNMHGEKWHGQDVLWSRKVCWKCLFQGSGDPIVKVSPFTANHGGTLGDTDLANSKKTQSFGRVQYLSRGKKIAIFFYHILEIKWPPVFPIQQDMRTNNHEIKHIFFLFSTTAP